MFAPKVLLDVMTQNEPPRNICDKDRYKNIGGNRLLLPFGDLDDDTPTKFKCCTNKNNNHEEATPT